MLLLDTTPLTVNALYLSVTALILVFFFLQLVRGSKINILRQVQGKNNIFYAGSIIIAVIVLLGYTVIPDLRLRIGLLSAGFFTLLVGAYDENKPLKPGVQLFWQTTIVILAVSWGWSIHYISNPFSQGIIHLDNFSLGGLILPGGLITVVWLLGLINAINWLDGVDGLAAGVGVIALMTLGIVSLLPSVQDNQTLTLALIGSGAILGFFLWNFPPARFYLGTSGSWFLGLYIGIVAIVGGGKIVTTLLVLTLPVLDMLFVIIQRIIDKRLPWQKDATRHIHHRLLALGLSHRSITAIGMFVSAILGIVAVAMQTRYKLITLVFAGLIFGIVTIILVFKQNGQKLKDNNHF